MPSLSETTGIDLQGLGYTRIDPAESVPSLSIPSTNQQPNLSSFLRCPLPPIWTTSPDSLRQFYQEKYPQVRLFNPTPVTAGSTTVINNGSTSESGGGGGGGSSTATIKAAQVSVTTSSLAPNATFVNQVTLSKSFQLLNLSATNMCRIQLYGTKVAQSGDAYRGLDVAPPAGTVQNIICDIALDTLPYQWTFQDRVGANGDSPQGSFAYITITNLSAGTASIGLTITYAPIVNS